MNKWVVHLIIGFFIFNLIIFLGFFISNIAKEQNKGIVTLTFDDGLSSQYEVVYPEMQRYKYNGVIFLIANWTGLFEGRELMNFEQAKLMQDNGWEIGSHTLIHKPLITLSEKELEDELKLSKQVLEDEGFKITTLAFPFGDYNEEVVEEAKNYYFASKPLEEGYNQLDNISFYELKSKIVMQEDSSEEVCSWIQKASSEQSWLILVFHHVGKEEVRWDISEQRFREILNCIDKTYIDVKTIKKVLEHEKRI